MDLDTAQLNELCEFELYCHQYSTTQLIDDHDSHAYTRLSRRRTPRNRRSSCSKRSGKNQNETLAEEPDIRFLEAFHQKLPRELRDMVYTYLIGYTTGFYNIQSPAILFLFPEFTPFTLIPKSLVPPKTPHPNQSHDQAHHHSHNRTPTTPQNIKSTLTTELLTTFLSTSSFYLCYRYTPWLPTLLTTPFIPYPISTTTSTPSNTSPTPTPTTPSPYPLPHPHIRTLYLALQAPESAEDDDDSVEFSWYHLFPSPQNTKCAWYRRRLDEDFVPLGKVLGTRCRVVVVVKKGFTYNERMMNGFQSMKRWVQGVVEMWRREWGVEVGEVMEITWL